MCGQCIQHTMRVMDMAPMRRKLGRAGKTDSDACSWATSSTLQVKYQGTSLGWASWPHQASGSAGCKHGPSALPTLWKTAPTVRLPCSTAPSAHP